MSHRSAAIEQEAAPSKAEHVVTPGKGRDTKGGNRCVALGLLAAGSNSSEYRCLDIATRARLNLDSKPALRERGNSNGLIRDKNQDSWCRR